VFTAVPEDPYVQTYKNDVQTYKNDVQTYKNDVQTYKNDVQTYKNDVQTYNIVKINLFERFKTKFFLINLI